MLFTSRLHHSPVAGRDRNRIFGRTAGEDQRNGTPCKPGRGSIGGDGGSRDAYRAALYLGAEEARPDPETVKAFLIKAGQVVIMSRGTWHSPAFAVSGQAKCYFMVEWKKT